MNEPSKSDVKLIVNVVSVLGTFFILAGLIYLMYHYTRTGEVDRARWAERTKNLAELRAANQEQLENYGWIDQKQDRVRLPVARAMELTVSEWQNPAAGRSNLLARLEKALPPLPAGATNISAATNVPAVAPARPK
jgi:hypothetical protein